MSRHIIWPAVLVALVGVDTRQSQDVSAEERPVAPAPRPKVPTFIVRSIKPADDSATTNRGFVLSYGLTDRDLDLVRKLPGVVEVVPVRFVPSEVKHLDRLTNVRVVATVSDYAELNGLKPSAGRFLTAQDDADKENVCTLGAAVAEKLFPFDDPLGKSVAVRGHSFKVVGVLAGENAGDDVFVPLGTARARFGDVIVVRTAGTRTAEKVDYHEIIVRVADPDARSGVADAVREALKKDHPKQDWEVGPR